jgi:hypothetical protein
MIIDTIINTIIWSLVYSFSSYHIAKLFGYEGKNLEFFTYTGLVMGAMRGLYSTDLQTIC